MLLVCTLILFAAGALALTVIIWCIVRASQIDDLRSPADTQHKRHLAVRRLLGVHRIRR